MAMIGKTTPKRRAGISLAWLIALVLAPLAMLSLYRGATNALGQTDSGKAFKIC